MADDQNSGDKTEQPTPQRLRQARRDGDVAKSKDVAPALGTIGLLIVIAVGGGAIATALVDYFALVTSSAPSIGAGDGGFATLLRELGGEGIGRFLLVSAIVIIPLAALGLFGELLQVGFLATSKKLKPKLDPMNPVEGLKRMFGKDGLVELVKTLVKAALIVATLAIVVRTSLPDAGAVGIGAVTGGAGGPGTDGGAAAGAALLTVRDMAVRLLAWGAAVFMLLAGLDVLYSRYSFLKKMRMSMRDIRDEHKREEGDPQLKGSRRQLHQEWASQNSVAAVGGAAALLVNPTHLAIALDYDGDKTPVPVVAARGAGPLAAAMREEAERAGIPIVRHVPAARRLWAYGEVGEIVPEDMFDVIAEVILWARRARDGDAPMEQELADERGLAERERPTAS